MSYASDTVPMLNSNGGQRDALTHAYNYRDHIPSIVQLRDAVQVRRPKEKARGMIQLEMH